MHCRGQKCTRAMCVGSELCITPSPFRMRKPYKQESHMLQSFGKVYKLDGDRFQLEWDPT